MVERGKIKGRRKGRDRREKLQSEGGGEEREGACRWEGEKTRKRRGEKTRKRRGKHKAKDWKDPNGTGSTERLIYRTELRELPEVREGCRRGSGHRRETGLKLRRNHLSS